MTNATLKELNKDIAQRVFNGLSSHAAVDTLDDLLIVDYHVIGGMVDGTIKAMYLEDGKFYELCLELNNGKVRWTDMDSLNV